eukprot:UN22976
MSNHLPNVSNLTHFLIHRWLNQPFEIVRYNFILFSKYFIGLLQKHAVCIILNSIQECINRK